MKKRGIVLIFILGILLISLGFVNANPSCGDTLVVDTILDGNMICSGTAITIGAHNMVLDCNGHTITYSTGGEASTYGVYIAGKINVTIKNCNIIDGNWTGGTNRYGMRLIDSDNSTIYNNTINVSNAATILLQSGSMHNNFSNLNLFSNSSAVLKVDAPNNYISFLNVTSFNSGGIWLMDDSENITLEHTRVFTSGTYGIYLYFSNNNFFYNVTSVAGNTYSSDSQNGIQFSNAKWNFIKDSFFSGMYRDVTLYSSSGESTDNIFLNCTYNSSNARVDALSSLIRKWYYNANVTYFNGTVIEGANITAYNNSGGVEFSVLTNSLGYVEQQNVTDYVNLGGTKTFNSKYSINMTHGSEFEIKFLNITLEQNSWDVFVSDLNSNAPILNINYPLNQTYYSMISTFNLTLTNSTPEDRASSCVYSLDYGQNISLDNSESNLWVYTNSSMNFGGHNIEFYCLDSSGDMNHTSVVFTLSKPFNITFPVNNVIVQRGAPFNILGNLSGNIEFGTNILNITLEYSGTSLGKVYFTSFSNESFNVSTELSAGFYNFSIYESGNPKAYMYNISNVGIGDVILVMGQSNAPNKGVGYSLVDYSSTLQKTSFVQSLYDSVYYDSAPTPSTLSDFSSMFPYAALVYNASLSEGVPFMVMVFTQGGSDLSQWQNVLETDYYRLALNQTNLWTGNSKNIKAVYWYQGENDISYHNTTDYYLNLSNLVNNSFTDFNILSGKFVTGQILKGASDTSDPSSVRLAQQDAWYNLENVFRGPITYDIQLPVAEVHFWNSGQEIYTEFSQRIMKSIMYSVYDVGENYPIVNNVYLINSTRLHLNFSKSDLEISNWNGTNMMSKAYGFNLTNSTSFIDDVNVISTSLLSNILIVDFNESISNMDNISICNSFSCYGKNIVRNSGNNLPMEIVYDMSLITSGQYVCTANGNYWYNSSCHNTAYVSPTTPSSSGGGLSITYDASKLTQGISGHYPKNYKIIFNGDFIQVKDILSNGVELNVSGEFVDIDFNESVKVDSDSDGFYDLEISLGGTNSVYAGLSIKSIYEEVPAVSEEVLVEGELGEEAKRVGFFRRLWDWIVGLF